MVNKGQLMGGSDICVNAWKMSSNWEEGRTEGEKVWKIKKFNKIFKEGNRKKNTTLMLEMKKGKRWKIKLGNWETECQNASQVGIAIVYRKGNYGSGNENGKGGKLCNFQIFNVQ